MLQERKWDIRFVRLCLLFVITVSMFCIGLQEQPAMASEAVEKGKLKNDGSQIHAGKYYYTVHYAQGLYISTVAGKKGRLILSKKESGMSFNSDVFLSGKYIYYSYSKGSSHKIYRMKLDGSGKKQIVSFYNKESFGGSIDFVYKDEYLLYSCVGDGSDVYNYSVHLKKKKVKYLKGYCVNFKASKVQNDVIDKYHYKQYYVAGVQAGDFYYDSVWVYNVKKQKFKRISKKAWDIALAGKYIYYLENSTSNSCTLICCTVDGKSKKTLCSIKGQYISFNDVTNNYCIYGVSGNYYKYDFSTGKTSKVIL